MRVAIIGGGAAGLFAACMLARGGMDTILLEKQDRVGRKLLATGNGRCNLSNLHPRIEDYYGSAAHIGAALRGFSPQMALDFFEELGLACLPDEAGRIYPLSNQAAGVLDALRLYAAERRCEIHTNFQVTRLLPQRNGFCIEGASQRIKADFVLVACGGMAAPKLGGGQNGYALLSALGHRISPKFPAIVPLKVDAGAVRGLKGIRMRGEAALYRGERQLRKESGEILFGDAGISGIAAMQLARQLNLELSRGHACTLKLNFLPGAPEGFLSRRVSLLPQRTMEDFLSGLVPRRLGQMLAKAAEIQPLSLTASQLSKDQLHALEQLLTGWTLPLRGTLGFDQAQVTCGGAELTDFIPETLESRLTPGLFAAGEVLNVDGDCGGFNLHWAWASAALAAREMLRRARIR